MTYGPIFTAILVAFIVSCKTKSNNEVSDIRSDYPITASKKFDIIDMAFLLPFPSLSGVVLKAGGDNIFDGSNSKNSIIFPKEQFMRLDPRFLDNFSDKYSHDELYDRLYITGFRYDPCFPIVDAKLDPHAPGCRLRAIRLVGQFIDFENNKALPASMHVLFLMKNSDRTADVALNNRVIAALKKLKSTSGVDTNGTPLGIHPGFNGPNSEAFAQEVKNLILTFTGTTNYFATSVFFRDSKAKKGTASWNWAQFLMKPLQDGSRGLLLEPTTGARDGITDDFGIFTLNSTNGVGSMSPNDADLRSVPDPTNPLFFPIPRVSPLLAEKPTADQIKAGITAADVFENPTMMTIPAGDCASCHVATQRRLANEGQLDSAFPRSKKFESSSGLTGTMDPKILMTMKSKPTNDPTSIIPLNFGYLNNRPVVSQRTVNEAVRVTELVNEAMWDGNW